jgi:hypothetical protein
LQANAKGVVPLEEEDIQESLYSSQDDGGLYSSGLLSQQVGLAAHGLAAHQETETTDLAPLDIHYSSDLFQTCRSVFSACCNQAEHVDGVEAVVRDSMADMTRRVQELVIQKKGKPQHYTGEFVSMYLPTDGHSVCTRKKHPAEPQRRKRKVTGKHQTSLEDSFLI